MSATDAPPSVTALIRFDRMNAAAAWRQSRLQVSVWWLAAGAFAVYVVTLTISGPLAFLLVQRLPFDIMFAIGTWIPGMMMWGIGLTLLGLVSWQWLAACRRKQLRYFDHAGIPREAESLYELRPDGLRMVSNGMEIVTAWPSIIAVERFGQDWIASANRLFFLIPCDGFSGKAEERAFIGDMLSRLTDAARARSPEAIRFAEALIPA